MLYSPSTIKAPIHAITQFSLHTIVPLGLEDNELGTEDVYINNIS